MARLVNYRPSRGGAVILGALPICGALALYFAAAAYAHGLDPAERFLPTLGAMIEQTRIMAFQTDPQTGSIPLWSDTAASLARLGAGLAIATALSLGLGLALGVAPLVRASLGPFVAAVAVIPPVAVLPILFIALGLGEAAKITLIVFGVTPFMIRDLAGHIRAIPEEQMVKAQTLGASTWQIVLRVALPQATPRLLESLRLSLGPAWVFLISAEAIASDVGLGYRIFLVRRYLAMDVILPYVAWITLLAFAMDAALRRLRSAMFRWTALGH